jgi:hypothetical protein
VPADHQFEIRLHLYILVYEGVTWSANPHMERTVRLDEIPETGARISIGSESFRVARVTQREEDSIIDGVLEDDVAVAVFPGGPADLVLPPFDQHALAARVRALEEAGWTRSFTPHVRTRT